MHHPINRLAHTTPVVEQWYEREIAPETIMRVRSDDPLNNEYSTTKPQKKPNSREFHLISNEQGYFIHCPNGRIIHTKVFVTPVLCHGWNEKHTLLKIGRKRTKHLFCFIFSF